MSSIRFLFDFLYSIIGRLLPPFPIDVKHISPKCALFCEPLFYALSLLPQNDGDECWENATEKIATIYFENVFNYSFFEG